MAKCSCTKFIPSLNCFEFIFALPLFMQSSQQTEHSRNPGPCVSATPSRLSGDLALVSTFPRRTPQFSQNASLSEKSLLHPVKIPWSAYYNSGGYPRAILFRFNTYENRREGGIPSPARSLFHQCVSPLPHSLRMRYLGIHHARTSLHPRR